MRAFENIDIGSGLTSSNCYGNGSLKKGGAAPFADQIISEGKRLMKVIRMKTDKPASVVDYYNQTVSVYDKMHGNDVEPTHTHALELAWPMLAPVDISSVLDVGCGTGLALEWFSRKDAKIALRGVDPAEGMLTVARERVPTAEFSLAEGESLPFGDACFDLVVATGILHHVPAPSKVILELFRVAKKAVLISDHNDLAMGPNWNRRLRLGLYAVGLLRYYYLIKQRGRRARYSDEDGWFYPFSILDHWDTLSSRSERIIILPTQRRGAVRAETFMLSQSHLATLCFKST